MCFDAESTAEAFREWLQEERAMWVRRRSLADVPHEDGAVWMAYARLCTLNEYRANKNEVRWFWDKLRDGSQLFETAAVVVWRG